ncbi:MAG: acetate--CoA ligase family protein [Desulfobacterales bacterium]|nr:acetate--CoA ligase family protein [Desulfobacterales bacterium]
MNEGVTIIKKAFESGRSMLSEYESKRFLGAYGIPVTREILVDTYEGFMRAVREIGYPLVVKGCSPHLAHKTEKGLVRVDLRNDEEAGTAFQEIMSGMEGDEKALLVQEMVKGSRELMVGMTRDAQFGPCVMFGLGGIFTEILRDVVFRVAPIDRRDALEMTQEIKARKILDKVRGLPPADMDRLSEILIRIGEIGLENETIGEIDINPLIISGSKPIAVDALVVLGLPS